MFERVSHAECSGESIGGRGHSKCNGLEAGESVQRGGQNVVGTGERRRRWWKSLQSLFPRGRMGQAQWVGLIRWTVRSSWRVFHGMWFYLDFRKIILDLEWRMDRTGAGDWEGSRKGDTQCRSKEKVNNSKRSNWQRINLKNIQATPAAQFQKNKGPNPKMGQRSKQTFLQRRRTDG